MFGSVGLPHGFCFLWNPELLWLHVISDSLIALAYFLIPLQLVRIVRGRKDIPFNAIFFCFAAFIVACGLTHVMEVVTLWQPLYWLSGGLKAVTAVVSLATLVVLVRLTPAILAIPGHRQLEAANRQLASVLESTTMCVLAMDRTWTINYMNGKAKALLNVAGDVHGMTLWEAFPAQLPEIKAKLLSVMETRRPATYEGYYEPFDLSTQAQAQAWDDGGITIFFNDVSEQKRLARELERERALRTQRIEVLARLSGELAHEIKNPLAIIHARASDLAEMAAETEGGAMPVEMVAKTCTSIVKTSDRAIRILRGLQALAREGARDPMQKADLATIVEQSVELVQRRYDTHGIGLEARVAAGLPAIECREVQVGQVLMNLLNNAFDAIESSSVTERWVRVEVSSDAEAGVVMLDVIDSGPGVAPEAKEHLMETFFTTKAVGAGIGIGLSVSRAIAEDHGGTLRLVDCGGHTCFKLTLPVKAKQEVSA
jgi:two-component system NtrC family sensor kinase